MGSPVTGQAEGFLGFPVPGPSKGFHCNKLCAVFLANCLGARVCLVTGQGIWRGFTLLVQAPGTVGSGPQGGTNWQNPPLCGHKASSKHPAELQLVQSCSSDLRKVLEACPPTIHGSKILQNFTEFYKSFTSNFTSYKILHVVYVFLSHIGKGGSCQELSSPLVANQ
jgi:hypothetical protein